MNIGFTGTREAITDAQRTTLTHWLTQNPAEEFHHGDCLGADAESHRIVRETNHQTAIHVHPCKIVAMRANCDGDRMYTPMEPLARNRMIVRACDVLLAVPKGEEEGEKRYVEHSAVRAA